MQTLNRRFPLTALLALAVALVALLSISGVLPAQSLRTERFYVKEFPFRAVAACQKNQGECLVVVAKGAQGWRGSQLEAALSTAGGWFNLVSDVPEPLQARPEVLRLSGRGPDRNSAGFSVERREASDLGLAGEFIADGDSLFYVSSYRGEDEDAEEDEAGADDDEAVSQSVMAKGWRWDGQNFA